MESLENLDAIINAITLLTIIRLIVNIQRPIVNNNRVEEDEVSSNTEIIFSPNLKRHVPFGNIMKQILKSCMESIDALIIEILNSYGIYDYIVYSSVYDKIRNSSSIISFCQMPIKYIFNESATNQVRNKKQYKEKNKQSNDYLLEKEKNDPNLEIKALNAIFNLPYIDFLEAYINDESTLIIKIIFKVIRRSISPKIKLIKIHQVNLCLFSISTLIRILLNINMIKIKKSNSKRKWSISFLVKN